MNKKISIIIVLLIGIGIGFGIGTMLSKPKIEQGQTEIKTLTEQLDASKADKAASEEVIRKASTEIARYKNELSRTKSALTQTVTQLANVKAKLEKMRSETEPVTVAAQSISKTSSQETTAIKSALPVGTVEYTVKEGDSLWNIAQNELGNGIRFKEIIELNPGLSENTVLQTGMKLKIPAK